MYSYECEFVFVFVCAFIVYFVTQMFCDFTSLTRSYVVFIRTLYVFSFSDFVFAFTRNSTFVIVQCDCSFVRFNFSFWVFHDLYIFCDQNSSVRPSDCRTSSFIYTRFVVVIILSFASQTKKSRQNTEFTFTTSVIQSQWIEQATRIVSLPIGTNICIFMLFWPTVSELIIINHGWMKADVLRTDCVTFDFYNRHSK